SARSRRPSRTARPWRRDRARSGRATTPAVRRAGRSWRPRTRLLRARHGGTATPPAGAGGTPARRRAGAGLRSGSRTSSDAVRSSRTKLPRSGGRPCLPDVGRTFASGRVAGAAVTWSSQGFVLALVPELVRTRAGSDSSKYGGPHGVAQGEG